MHRGQFSITNFAWLQTTYHGRKHNHGWEVGGSIYVGKHRLGTRWISVHLFYGEAYDE
jgi:hypothetical protein